jgi:hypothetical protein
VPDYLMLLNISNPYQTYKMDKMKTRTDHFTEQVSSSSVLIRLQEAVVYQTMLPEFIRLFTKFRRENYSEILPQIRPRPSTSFPLHYSLSLGAI